MPIALMVLGFGLVVAGLAFAIKGFGHDSASGNALRGLSVSGPSWLILVAIGSGVIVYGGWQFETERTQDQFLVPHNAPVFYGEDVDLDELWDSCAEGNMSDCDELYFQSPVGSDYEWFGGTCGGVTDDPNGASCEPVTD